MEADRDLGDALIAWQGGELAEERREELLSRLREDGEFRRELAGLVWTLSTTRVAQAPEPRWLELMEELEPGEAPEDELATRLMDRLRLEPARFVPAWWRTVAAVATVLVVAFAGAVLWLGNGEPKTEGPPIAVLVPSEFAEFRERIEGNTLVGRGLIRLESGSARLLFTNGVEVDFEGPARLRLDSEERITCLEGRIRTYAPPGAAGFCVVTPQGVVRDLGTELGISVSPGGRSQVTVIEGRAEVSVRIPGQDGVRSALLNKDERVAFDAATGSIGPGSEEAAFPVAAPELPPLVLPGNYRDRILEAGPKLYWRLDREIDGRIPNEIVGGPGLRRGGGVRVHGNHSAEFGGKAAPGALFMDETWNTPATACAVEFWFVAGRVGRMDLAALTPSGSRTDHLALVELGGPLPEGDHEAGVVRYLLRWPAGQRDGMNLYSSPLALPYQWHHVVAQQENGKLELFVDGISAGIARTDEAPVTVPARWQFGALRMLPGDDPATLERVFAGRMAEIAVYDRLLSPAEIRERSQSLLSR